MDFPLPAAADRGKFFARLAAFLTPPEEAAKYLFGPYWRPNGRPGLQYGAAVHTVIEGMLERNTLPYLVGPGLGGADLARDDIGRRRKMTALVDVDECLADGNRRSPTGGELPRYESRDRWIALIRSASNLASAGTAKTVDVSEAEDKSAQIFVYPPSVEVGLMYYMKQGSDIVPGIATTEWRHFDGSAESKAFDMEYCSHPLVRNAVYAIFDPDTDPSDLAGSPDELATEMARRLLPPVGWPEDFTPHVRELSYAHPYIQHISGWGFALQDAVAGYNWTPVCEAIVMRGQGVTSRQMLDLLWCAQVHLGWMRSTYADVPAEIRIKHRRTTVITRFDVATDGTVAQSEQETTEYDEYLDHLSWRRGISAVCDSQTDIDAGPYARLMPPTGWETTVMSEDERRTQHAFRTIPCTIIAGPFDPEYTPDDPITLTVTSSLLKPISEDYDGDSVRFGTVGGSLEDGRQIKSWPCTGLIRRGYVKKARIAIGEGLEDRAAEFAPSEAGDTWEETRAAYGDTMQRIAVEESDEITDGFAPAIGAARVSRTLEDVTATFIGAGFTQPQPIKAIGSAVRMKHSGASLYVEYSYSHDDAQGRHIGVAVAVRRDSDQFTPIDPESDGSYITRWAIDTQTASMNGFQEDDDRFDVRFSPRAFIGVDWDWKSMPVR